MILKHFHVGVFMKSLYGGESIRKSDVYMSVLQKVGAKMELKDWRKQNLVIMHRLFHDAYFPWTFWQPLVYIHRYRALRHISDVLAVLQAEFVWPKWRQRHPQRVSTCAHDTNPLKRKIRCNLSPRIRNTGHKCTNVSKLLLKWPTSWTRNRTFLPFKIRISCSLPANSCPHTSPCIKFSRPNFY